jgi:hypothetical protein
VPFYTGRYVIEIEELGNDLVTKEGPFFVMIRDKNEEMEKKLLSGSKLYVLAKQEMGTNRALVLLSNREVQKTVIIGDPLKKFQNKAVPGAALP